MSGLGEADDDDDDVVAFACLSFSFLAISDIMSVCKSDLLGDAERDREPPDSSSGFGDLRR